MLIDITLNITPELIKDVPGNTSKALVGHVGTHFDVMEKEFPLDYIRRKGILFDVSAVKDRDISTEDIAIAAVEQDMFVAFYTGFMDAVGYGTKAYFAQHPQLSDHLIDTLLNKGVSIIGIDCAGIRRGSEHVPTDRRCAKNGTFVIENLADLPAVLAKGGRFIAHTYPMRFSCITGLPSRVVAEI